MLLLVAVWVLFMRQYRGPQQTALAEQKRHNDAPEKILESHEARLRKLEAENGS
jgi:hypothetical protein